MTEIKTEEDKKLLTSVATPALTRNEDRREPARGRAAAGAAERRRAAAGLFEGKKKERKKGKIFS